MRVATRSLSTQFARGALGPREGLLIAGFFGAALVAQKLRAAGRRGPDVRHALAKLKPQAQNIVEDDCADWGTTSAPFLLKEVQEGQIVLLDEELPLTPKELWKLIYDPQFQKEWFDQQGSREYKIGKWGKAGDELVRRTEHVSPIKKRTCGPREAYTEEEFKCIRRGDGGFMVDNFAYNRKMPYGGTFHIRLSWTAVKLDRFKTRLQVVGGIIFEKRIISIVKNLIRGAAQGGMEETYKAYQQHLWNKIRSQTVPLEQGQSSRLKSASTATRLAEDLIKTGVFVSWGQLISWIMLGCIAAALVKASMNQRPGVLSFNKWEGHLQTSNLLD